MQNPPSVWKPSLAAGFIFGFVSGIPVIEALNCLCCSLLIGAGITCSYLMVKSSSIPLSVGRSATGGALTGVFAVPIWFITWVSFKIILGQNLAEEFEEAINQAAQMTPEAQEAAQLLSGVGLYVFATVFLVIMFFAYTLFGMLGGIIGRAIFERRTPAPPAGTGAPPTVTTQTPDAPPPPPVAPPPPGTTPSS
jgi:hypothetical protein